MYYQIQGTVGGHQIPTFYLNSNVQGIVDAEHAEQIAREVVNPTNKWDIEVHLYVTTVYA